MAIRTMASFAEMMETLRTPESSEEEKASQVIMMVESKQPTDLEYERIEWRFKLERAPWWGGMFERMVESVKSCLKKVLGNARLSFDEVSTHTHRSRIYTQFKAARIRI